MRDIWSELASKKESNEPIELEVISRNRGGVVTHYKGVEVFIPMSHWTLLRQSDEPQGESKGNEKVLANVLEMTDFDTDARRVTATRRPILRKSLLDSLEVGQRINGRVSSILDFGVFVDLGGIDGLLHTSEISYTRGRHPSQLLSKGEEVEVVVREIDRDKERIYLGRKELLPSPWDQAEEKYPVGSIQAGKVVGLGKMGAFIELEPGIEGFVRASELSWTKRIHNPKEVLKKGQDVQVKVLDVSGRKKRLSLSFRQAQANPWDTLSTKYAVGTSWEGEIKEISNKGLVVGLEDVEGFLPRGRMGREAKRLPDMKAGDKITVSVIEVDPQRLSLIFGLPMPEREQGEGGGERGERGGGRERRGGRDDRRGPMPSPQPVNEMKSSETVGSFSIGDMIGQSIKEKLFPNLPKEEKKPAPKAEPAVEPGATAAASGTPPMADQGSRAEDQQVPSPSTSPEASTSEASTPEASAEAAPEQSQGAEEAAEPVSNPGSEGTQE
jgi:small subunit ribosomal protein S1